MSYQAPIRDLAFCLEHIIGANRLAETELFADATEETRAAILDEAVHEPAVAWSDAA